MNQQGISLPKLANIWKSMFSFLPLNPEHVKLFCIAVRVIYTVYWAGHLVFLRCLSSKVLQYVAFPSNFTLYTVQELTMTKYQICSFCICVMYLVGVLLTSQLSFKSFSVTIYYCYSVETSCFKMSPNTGLPFFFLCNFFILCKSLCFVSPI